MFGRKEKAAIAALPPQHRALVTDRTLAVTQSPAQWAELFTSLAAQPQAVHKHPIPPRALEVLLPLIRALSEDVEPTAGIGVRIDLRGYDAPGKTGPGRDLPSNPPVSHLQEFLSWDPWLVIDAPLRDGSELELAIVDVVRTRKYRKRSASGKTKFKNKSKVTQRVTGKLTLPKGRAVAAPARSSATSFLAVSTKPKGSRQLVIARGKYAFPAAPQPGWQLNTIMLVIGELFRWVAPADAAVEAGGGTPA